MPVGPEHKVDFLLLCALWVSHWKNAWLFHGRFNQGLELVENVLSKQQKGVKDQGNLNKALELNG